MKKRKLIFILILSIFILLIGLAYAHNLPKWFNFQKKDALDEWQEKVFKNKVLYVVEPQQEGGYLLAKSKQACSALLYRIKFDPKKFPMISWKWKIIEFPFDRIIRELDGHLEGKREGHIIIRKTDKFWPLVKRINILLDKLKRG